MSSVPSAALCSIQRARQPAAFRGETIIHESAHAHMAKHEHLL